MLLAQTRKVCCTARCASRTWWLVSEGFLTLLFECFCALRGSASNETEHVRSGLVDTMTSSLAIIVDKSVELNVSLRIAAYVVSLERIASVYESRGLFP